MNLLEKVNNNFRENKMFYLLVLTFFFVGILLGAYTIKYMDSTNAKDLSDYFTTFLKSISNEEIKSKELFFNIIKNNILIILFIIALGFTFFGGPIILLIDLVKGFMLGYSFSFLLTTFNGKGVWIGIASTLPQNLLYIPFFVGISIISLELSSIKLKSKFFNLKINNKFFMKEVYFKYTVLIGLFLLGALIECYVSPGLIKMVITKVYKLT